MSVSPTVRTYDDLIGRTANADIPCLGRIRGRIEEAGIVTGAFGPELRLKIATRRGTVTYVGDAADFDGAEGGGER